MNTTSRYLNHPRENKIIRWEGEQYQVVCQYDPNGVPFSIGYGNDLNEARDIAKKFKPHTWNVWVRDARTEQPA